MMTQKINRSRNCLQVRVLVILTAAFLIQSTVCAEPLLFDGFDYPVGEKLSGNAGGKGWGGNDFWGVSGTGAAAIIENAVLKGPKGYSLSTGKSFRLTPGSTSASVKRSFSKKAIDLSPESTATYYFSELFSRVDKENGSTGETPFFLSLRNESTKKELFTIVAGSQESIIIRVTPDATGLSEMASSQTGNNRYQAGASFDTAPQYLLLGKMVLNPKGKPDEFFLSVIPANGEISPMEPSSWDLHLRADASGIIDQLYVGTTVNAETIYISNICIAPDYKSAISE